MKSREECLQIIGNDIKKAFATSVLIRMHEYQLYIILMGPGILCGIDDSGHYFRILESVNCDILSLQYHNISAFDIEIDGVPWKMSHHDSWWRLCIANLKITNHWNYFLNMKGYPKDTVLDLKKLDWSVYLNRGKR